jgi:hypothetical protein
MPHGLSHRRFDEFEDQGFGFGQPGGAQTGTRDSLSNRFLGTAGQVAGLTPQGFAISQAIGLGGRFLSYLGGRGERKKAERQLATDRAGLESQLGTDVFRPQDIAFSARTQARRGVGREAELVNRRLGLDTGAAQTDILRGIAGRNQGIVAELELQNALQKSRRDAAIRRLLLDLHEHRRI